MRSKAPRPVNGWLAVGCGIVLVLLCAPLAVKKHFWWEDGRGPNARTSAWQPYRLYSPDVEEALAILQSIDPSEVAYLRSRGNPVFFVSGKPGIEGDTTFSGVIEISQRFRGKPAEIAVVLSHEIIHAERHDPIATPREYSLLRRLLWHNEEETAHCKGLSTALRICFRYPSVWHVLGAQWLLEPPLYLLVGPVSLLACVTLIVLILRLSR